MATDDRKAGTRLDFFTRLNFGARIGGGFALVLIVAIIGLAVSLRTTSDLAGAITTLDLAEEVVRSVDALDGALDDYSSGAGAAQRVTDSIDQLDNALSDLSAPQHTSPELSGALDDARDLLSGYRTGFAKLREHTLELDQQTGVLHWILEQLVATAGDLRAQGDRDYENARRQQDAIDSDRNRAAQGAEAANAAIAALSVLRYQEARLRGTGGLVIDETRHLVEDKFGILEKTVPELKELLPQLRGDVRKFDRWLRAYRSAFMRYLDDVQRTRAAGTLRTASILLQVDASRLYRSAVADYDRLKTEAGSARRELARLVEQNRITGDVHFGLYVMLEESKQRTSNRGGLRPSEVARLEEMSALISTGIETGRLRRPAWNDIVSMLAQLRAVQQLHGGVAQSYAESAMALRALREGVSSGISAIAEAERDSVIRSKERGIGVVVFTLVVVVALSVFLAAWITRNLARELGALSTAMRQVVAGESAVEVPYTARQDQTGEMAKAITVFRDNAVALRRNEGFLTAIFEHIPNMVFVKEAEELRFVRMNRAGEQLTGISRAELMGCNDYDFFPEKQAEFFVDKDREVLRDGVLVDIPEERIETREHGTRVLHTRKIPIMDEQGEPAYLLGISEDITDSLSIRKQLEHQERHMRHLAHHDDLTGLPNRILLRDRVGHAVRHAARDDSKVAVLFIDLDRFKQINDSLGHAVGDALLQQVGNRLCTAMRASDTIARVGGDEFVAVLEGIESAEVAGKVARKVIDSFNAPFPVEGHTFYISASIGVSLCPGDGDEAETLLRNADAAMYRAKGDGGNTFCFYTEDMTTQVLENLVLETSLREALEQQQFELHYQPQYDMASGDLIGLEALVRWRHPEQGLVSPAKFIPLAEDTGLILPLGRWVMAEGCRQMRKWLDEGLDFGVLSVNLSLRQLHDPELLDQIIQVLRDTGLEPRRFALEITEGSVMKNPTANVVLFQALREAGVSLSLDDFGTGYSSLAYLKLLPIDLIKIDRSFVRDIPDNTDDMAIARSIIALAHSLDMAVLAEGVETESQATFLRDEGCDAVQGFIYSKPLPEAELRAVHGNQASLSVASSAGM